MNTSQNRHGVQDPVARVAKNSMLLMLSKVIQVAYGLLSAALIARYLGVELFGQYAFVTSFILVFIPLSFFGMQRILIREMARNKENAGKYLGAALVIRGTLSVVMVLAVVTTTQFIELSYNSLIAIYIFAFSEIILSFTDLFINVFIAFEKMGYDTKITVISRISALACILFVIQYDLGFINLFLALLFPNVIALFLSYILTRKRFIHPKIEIDFPLWKFLAKESYPMLFATLFTQLFLRVDVFVLKAVRSVAEVSLFFAPYTLIMRLQLIPQTITMALFPAMSRLAVTSRSSFEDTYAKAFKFLFVISLPIAVMTMFLADQIITLIFGGEFVKAATSLRILIWAINLTFIETLFMLVLISLNKQGLIAAIYLIVFIVNLVLDLILVPFFGYVGACIGTLIAYVVRTGLTFYFVSRLTFFLPIHKIVLKPTLSVIVMGIILSQIKSFNIFFTAPTSLLIYLVILFFFRSFSEEEIDLFKRALNRN